ncbi:hypothetical protein, partial [Flavobacterium sp. UBA6046]|uniref:hypothetical protein n=1 Tax=Flavobacterium sp. UBA6046 TaxID=1946552 RepID=UPI0025BCB581
KTKKMSLANIEGRLTPDEMENIMAGSGGEIICGFALGLGLVTSVATGGWSMVGAFMVCSGNAY